MVMILDAFMSRFSNLLADIVCEEVVMVLGVKDELRKLQKKMASIQCLLKDAEKKKFDDSSIAHWLSELKDVMYDAEDIIDLCRIEGAKLIADQNPKSKTTPVCCNFSSAISCFTSVPLRHEIGNKIKQLNDRLNRIYENRIQFKLEGSEKPETPQITLVDSRQTDSMVDPLVVGREVEDDANRLVDHLVAEEVEKKCLLFAVIGMGGIGKTTLAQKIYNHQKIQTYFNLKVWVCVSQTYSETELLKQVIRGAKGDYGEANTKAELLDILRESLVSGQNLILVLDDVWRADLWVDLLRVPLYRAKSSVRVLVTTRSKDVATSMKAAQIHFVMELSIESSWDMLRRRLFSDEEEGLANDLKDLGIKIVKRCRGLPLAIKAIAGVLEKKERTRKVWDNFLKIDAWSIKNLPEDLRGALYLSFEDLPSHLKQCFLYLSLYPEDIRLGRNVLSTLWVAEGFVTEQKDSLMEDLAEECFKELLRRNLLLPSLPSFPSMRSLSDTGSWCVMHDVVRSLALFLSKEETSSGDLNVRNSTTSTKLRRLSVIKKETAAEILDSVAEQGDLRTLLAANSDLLLDDERLRRLSHLRVLQIKRTKIQILPDSIGKLVHLRYLDLSSTQISAIPESIEHLTNLQFLDIKNCENLTQLPSGITRLHNLRHLDLSFTSLSFVPKGIGKLQHLNNLSGFVPTDNDSSSNLEELTCLKQIRKLYICNLKRAQSGDIILKELPYLSDLVLSFSPDRSDSSEEERRTVEKLFDQLIPPPSLEILNIYGFFGSSFPDWMALSSYEKCVPFLTKLFINDITSCTQLPPLGQLPELRELTIYSAKKVKKIGPEFLGGGINSTTRIAFPKLKSFRIENMPVLEEWSFGAQVEENASPRLKLLPCLQKLQIRHCPLLKQLPEGLKHSAMKSLQIHETDSLKSVDDLPTETEELEIIESKNLEKVCCLPPLKRLVIENCEALSCVDIKRVEKELEFRDGIMESLPEWLLMLLRQRELQNDTNEDFVLRLECSEMALRGCVKGGSHWELIQHIPHVIAHEAHIFHREPGYLRYSKRLYVYDTNL